MGSRARSKFESLPASSAGILKWGIESIDHHSGHWSPSVGSPWRPPADRCTCLEATRIINRNFRIMHTGYTMYL